MNLPKLAGDIKRPHMSVSCIIRTVFPHIDMCCAAHCRTNNKWYSDSFNGGLYNDEIIEWWPMPEIGTGNKIL